MELSALIKCLDFWTHFLKQCNKQMENREDYIHFGRIIYMLMTCWCEQEFLLLTDIFLENVTPDSVFLAFISKVCCFGEFLSYFLFFPAFLT